MPELPEVENMVRDVEPLLSGRTIEQATLVHADVLYGVTPRALTTGLRGARITSLERRAKNAVILTNRRRLVIQPGMTGTMMVKTDFIDADRRYGVLRLDLDNRTSFLYHDVRRLGTIRWLDDEQWETFSDAIGPEPLGPSFTAEALAAAVAHRSVAIKKILMDQRRVAGVGNIYANEALFAAGIDPSKEGKRLTMDQVAPLHRHLVRILATAVAAKGTTVRDYRNGRGEPGNFQGELLVYDRAGEPCRQCGTTLSGTHVIDGRITVFCHRCQT